MNTSIKLNTPCELINLTPLNPLISKCQIKVCYVGEDPNRNGSIITKEVATKMANSLPGSPIVGFYNEYTEDFEEHNRIIDISNGKFEVKDTTKPYGFVDLNAQVWFQDYLDGEEIHTYLVTEGYIWTGQYPEANRILINGNNQSMELDEKSLNAHWAIDDKSGMEFFIINDAIISKLCILGEDVEPCFEGANITKFSLDDEFSQKIYNLMKEVRKLKGGSPDVDELKDKQTPETEPETEKVEVEVEEVEASEAEVTSEEVESVEETVETPSEEETETVPEEKVEEEEIPEEEKVEEVEDTSNKFSLEEIQTLQERCSTLEAQLSELQESYNTLTASYNTLVEFKNTKDRETKQAMIDSFYMLSEAEKADVQNNIDTYSVDEIEAKLSIICVRNKLNLSETVEETHNVETTFSLDADDEDAESVPALVTALRRSKRND